MSSPYLKRFSLGQRLQHLSVMTTFTLLVITGIPQKFYETGWARFVIDLLGGIDLTRWVHRAAGVVFAGLVALHVLGLVLFVLKRPGPLSIVPTRKDFRDTLDTLRYYLGLTQEHPRFDRFDYKQKFEYWGMVMGSAIMVVTGVMLLLPTLATSLLPGQFIPAAKTAHSNEGMMAFLVIIVWHIYNAHLNPDVFPFDRTIFTGKISRHRMEHEHPLELERLEASEAAQSTGAAQDAGESK